MAHLHTIVGGKITTLRPMLEHYLALGVQSVTVNVHLASAGDPLLEEVRAITSSLGVSIGEIVEGALQDVNSDVHARSRMRYPEDWHIIADQDEFQLYPMPIVAVEKMCERHGYDHVCGAFLDRFASDGTMAPLNPHGSIWEQYPVAAFVTFPLLRGAARKVVLMRAHVPLMKGQHVALQGVGCPMSECCVQVHHFKWVEGIVDWLKSRAKITGNQAQVAVNEGARFIQYMTEHDGRIDLAEEKFLASGCRDTYGDYPHWPLVTRWLLLYDLSVSLMDCLKPGPAALTKRWRDVIGVNSQLTPLVTESSVV
jgi:hypothetical protein